MTSSGHLLFPPFRLDVANANLWRGNREIRLTPKAFSVLLHLAERHGQLVTKDGLLAAVWPNIAVGDGVLKVCVREIRKALGDRVDAPRFVTTVHRRGYRFIAGVTRSDDRPEGAGSRPKRTPVESALALPPRVYRPTPLVARESELEHLQRSLDEALRGVRQVVFVTGEPGIGKTGLVDTFLERVRADPRVWIAQGQCVETYGTGEPYLPMLDALARLCRGREGAWMVSLLRRHAPTWLVQMPWLIDTGDREALHRELLGATRHRMLREMAEALEALTAAVPLVLALEDLHWSDSATLDLLSSLARRREPARLLVVGTYRAPDLAATPHPLTEMQVELQRRGYCRELSLELLPEAAVEAYLRERLPGEGDASDLARVIHRRTEGNPLFMVSVVDDLVARGLVGARGRAAARAVLEDVAVSLPETVRHTIVQQIGRLGRDAQRMLEAGSVAGMEFSAAGVAAALGRDPLAIEEACDELAQRQLFIRSLAQGESSDGAVTGRYEFIHSLHRNTLYQQIPPVRRRGLHQSLGERAEQSHADGGRAIPAGLAVHFEHAGDDRRAVRYLREAAETALRRHANGEAVGHLEHALDVSERLAGADRMTVRLDLLEQLGLARRSMADVSAAVRDFAALAGYAREHGRGVEEIRALLYLASSLSWIDRNWSLAAVEQALRVVQDIDDPLLRAHVHGYRGVQRILSLGWRDEDAEACHAAVRAAGAASDRALLSLHVGHWAYLQSHRSEYRAACATAEQGLRLALEEGDAYDYMACQFHRAWALLHLGEWGQTRRVIRDGLQMAEQNGHDLWARAFTFHMAWLLVEAGDFESARALCERALQSGREGQLGRLLGSIVLGLALLGLGHREAARRAFEHVTTRIDRGPAQMDWILQMPLRAGLSACWLAGGNFARAREEAAELCRLAATAGEHTYLALGQRALAEAALGERDGDAAGRGIAEALRALAGREAPLAEWRVCATAARHEEAQGARAPAAGYWLRSAAALDRLAASLEDDVALVRTFLGTPVAQVIRHRADGAGSRAASR